MAIKERLGLDSVTQVAELPDSHEVWQIVGNYLGTMCSNIFLTTSVEKISLGGGIFNRSVLLDYTRSTFKQRINQYLVHEKIDTE